MSILRTERLLLRKLDLHDAGFILELSNETAFIRFIGDKGVRTLADAREYLLKGPIASYERWGFGLYSTCIPGGSAATHGTAIGICGLVKRDSLPDVDLGFAFLSRYRSKGYAVESASAVLHYARTALRLHRIVAITAPDNAGSIAVLEKIGLVFERMIRLGETSPELRLYGPAQSADSPTDPGPRDPGPREPGPGTLDSVDDTGA